MLRLLKPQAAKPMSAAAMRPFVATQQRSIFDNAGRPQPPGFIVGTVNDAVQLPKSDPYHGSYHWSFERLVSASLVPLTAWPLITGSLPPLVDATLGALLLTHCHIGLGSCITDYIPTRRFPKLNPACFYLLGAGTAVGLYGVYKLETEEEGLVGAAKKLWDA